MAKKVLGKKPAVKLAKKANRRDAKPPTRVSERLQAKWREQDAKRVSKITGQSVEEVLQVMASNAVKSVSRAEKPAKRPYERKNHNLDLMAPPGEGFYLYAVTKDKVKHNNRLLLQRLEEVRRMIGIDPGLPYNDSDMLDDPAWLFRDDDDEGPDDPTNDQAGEDAADAL